MVEHSPIAPVAQQLQGADVWGLALTETLTSVYSEEARTLRQITSRAERMQEGGNAPYIRQLEDIDRSPSYTTDDELDSAGSHDICKPPTDWLDGWAVLELPESGMMSEGQNPIHRERQRWPRPKESARPWVKLLDESPVSNND